MHVWDYNLPKNWKPKTDQEWIWYLERLINYGLGGDKLNRKQLKKYFNRIKMADNTKAFLELLLWKKPY